LSRVGKDVQKRQEIFDARFPEMKVLRPKLLEAEIALSRAASQLMRDIVGV
jgi:hypothetical protein